MAHTKGEWRIGKSRKDVWSGDLLIATILHETNDNANARLIASAPDLLEALYAISKGFKDGSIKWTKKRWSDSDPYHPANTLMCRAIAKAEGKEI